MDAEDTLVHLGVEDEAEKPPSPKTIARDAALDADRPKAPRHPKRFRTLSSDGGEVRRSILPLWDFKWTPDILRQQYDKMTPREFDRMMRQMAVADGELLFAPYVDAALDRSLELPTGLSKHWKGYTRDAGVDLAIAEDDVEKDTGSYFVFLGIALDEVSWTTTVIQMERHRGISPGQQYGIIGEGHETFRYGLITVESNNYQKAVVRHFAEDVHEMVPVVAYQTDGRTKRDIKVGIPSMEVEFRRGRWKIPWGDARSRRIMEPLVEELRAYPTPGFTYDCLMGLFLAREGRRNAVAEAAPEIHSLNVGL